jgi:hypothetical protein
MCEKCVEIDKTIERYRRILHSINDQITVDRTKELIATLEGQKAALHPGKGCVGHRSLSNFQCPAVLYFGGCNSLFNQPVAVSVFRGSGLSQSKHWNVRLPLPPGRSARIR